MFPGVRWLSLARGSRRPAYRALRVCALCGRRARRRHKAGLPAMRLVVRSAASNSSARCPLMWLSQVLVRWAGSHDRTGQRPRGARRALARSRPRRSPTARYGSDPQQPWSSETSRVLVAPPRRRGRSPTARTPQACHPRGRVGPHQGESRPLFTPSVISKHRSGHAREFARDAQVSPAPVGTLAARPNRKRAVSGPTACGGRGRWRLGARASHFV